MLSTLLALKIATTLGTLVVMAPSRDGLVVAADSRSLRANNRTCDTAYKIVAVKSAEPAVFAVTGLSKIHGHRPGADPCREPGMTALDLEETARQQLERHGLPATVAAMTRLGEASIAAAQRAQTLDPRIAHLYATYRGKRVHEIALGSYDTTRQEAVLARVAVRVSALGTLEVTDETYVRRIGQQAERLLEHFGQSDYVNGPLLRHGQQHIRTVLRFLGLNERLDQVQRKTVADTSADAAVHAAVNLIEGAAALTATIPAEAPIGGPVDVVLLSKTKQVSRVRWK